MKHETLVKKWLSGELSEAEQVDFKSLEEAALYEEIILEAQRFKGDHTAKMPSFEDFDHLLANKKKNQSFSWTKMAMKIAAVLVVGFAVYSLVGKYNVNSFQTEYAQKETITLPDHSIVNLNQLSELEYSVSSWDDNRRLKLNGEAFFDVEKGKRFDVVTHKGTVSVKGTEFNVLSVDSIFKVSCYEGLVNVSYENKTIMLPAGTEFILTNANAIKTDIAIAEPYWLKNMSVFQNAPLEAVFKDIEQHYDIKVDYREETSINFTGAFEHNNLENALKSITHPLNLNFIISQNNKEVKVRNAEN